VLAVVAQKRAGLAVLGEASCPHAAEAWNPATPR